MNKTLLTPDLINTATGRELDTLVAEHVTSVEPQFTGRLIEVALGGTQTIKGEWPIYPAYSTSGDAMLALLERMRGLEFFSEVGHGPAGIVAKFFAPVPEDAPKWTFAACHMAKGETPPEAVCRAALLAIFAQKEAA